MTLAPTYPASRAAPRARSFDRGVAAVLGPTNTGKTHHAIERMLSFSSGVIGLPLRLLAREVYNRVAERIGADNVALVTGEEKIKPRAPAYWVATVEAMPRDVQADFLAIDEIQLAADLDRGHIFTDRLLNWRGRQETLLIGAATMAPLVSELFPNAPIFTRPRLSELSFAGDKKISRLPPRSAIVAFSAEEVYAIAELIKRQCGGAAVVLGALSPRTRNAQVEIYQSGDVDYIVATDAIGMGLNLDVDHVAFASDRKFDGLRHRRLTPAEFGQIAGRAGRHMSDGFFSATARCPPFDDELIESLEDHRFDPVKTLQWRSGALDFSSIQSLIHSLDQAPTHPDLVRARLADDQRALEAASRDEIAQRNAKAPADVARLWEACQIPDYRKTSPAAHAELALAVFAFIARRGKIPEDWMARQIEAVDRIDGDIATLSSSSGASAHCKFYRQPFRLARRLRALAERRASGRGQHIRRVARPTDATFRRSPHQHAGAPLKRERDARSRNQRRRRRYGRRPARRKPSGLSLHARSWRGRRSGEGAERGGAEGARGRIRGARDSRVRRGRRRLRARQ